VNVIGVGVFLVTSAVGYWVLTLADKEGNRHAKLGRFLGWGILALSLLGILGQVFLGGGFLGHPGRGHSMFGHPGHGHGHWGGGDEDDGEKSSPDAP
jgi:hypothetical protein